MLPPAARIPFLLATAASLACGSAQAPPPSAADALPPVSSAPPSQPRAARGLDADGLFLQPNAVLPDGSPGYVHVTEADMPLRIAIALPPVPAQYASCEETRQVAIDAMQLWERAIQPEVPWFRLEFVEKDPTAPVQIEWKRRITGPWAGFGEILHGTEDDGTLWVGGRIQVSTTPGPYTKLDIDEIRLLIAHEFGHVLGLGHCFECDSAMSYSYDTRERVFVTETDVRTFRALLDQPNLSATAPAPPPAAGAASR